MPDSGGEIAAHRFTALDSLRGLCALAVVLFHFKTGGLLSNLPAIRHGWIFVDFFFVLSGFVLAHAYFGRVGREVSVWRFLGLRLGRIYPLHAAVLAAMVVLELVKLAMPGLGAREAFGPGRTVPDLIASLLLLHSSGFTRDLVWNVPSWSIAAEFWAYAAFALLVLTRRIWPFALLAAVSVLTLLAVNPDLYDATYDAGTIRCFYGFSLGVITWSLRGETDWRPSPMLAALAELLFVAAVIGFATVVWGGPRTLAAPILFAGAVFVFADDAGPVSRLLATRLPVLLGTLSYSIYMIHPLVQGRVMEALARFGLARTGVADSVTATGLTADAITLVMLVLVIGVAALAYRWIEKPARDWSRRRLRAPAVEAEAPTF
ncbi:MAG: acyltransferase [Proteobacteria bacterium]|nr:acyltransferase [Pseudomonadota bacterium]